MHSLINVLVLIVGVAVISAAPPNGCPNAHPYAFNRGRSCCMDEITVRGCGATRWTKCPERLCTDQIPFGIILKRETFGNVMDQISVGDGMAWALVKSQGVTKVMVGFGLNASNRLEANWREIESPSEGSLSFITVGENGKIAGLNRYGDFYYRDGVCSKYPFGKKWRKMNANLRHVAIGNNKSIWGISKSGRTWHRSGFGKSFPYGRAWKPVSGIFKHISAGGGKVIGVTPKNNVFYRVGITADDYAGVGWRKLDGKLKEVYVRGASILGVSPAGNLFVRIGVDRKHPHGRRWVKY